MPPAPWHAARPNAAASTRSRGLGNLDVLALVFSHLPPGEQCFTASRVGREWAAWAAPLAGALRAQATEAGERGGALAALPLFSLPLWMMQEAWPRLTLPQQRCAAARAARHGDLESLRWALTQPQIALSPAICTAAAAGGHLAALRAARAAGCAWGSEVCRLAAAGGHLELLRWAMDEGCAWDGQACAQELVPLLLSGDPAAAAGAAEALQRMFAADDDSTLNAEGLFPALIGALGSPEARVICAAAAALAAATRVNGLNPTWKLIPRVPGWFDALAGAMRLSDAAEDAGDVLVDICTTSDEEISRPGITATVRALSAALAAGNAASAAQAARTLGDIAYYVASHEDEPPCAARLLADTEGAVPALMAALRSGDDATAAAAASALATMAERLDEERADAVASTDGLLEALVEAMGSTTAREGSSCALRHVFCTGTHRARRVAAVPGALPGLVESLQGSPRDASCAVAALSDITADDGGALLRLAVVPGAHLALALMRNSMHGTPACCGAQRQPRLLCWPRWSASTTSPQGAPRCPRRTRACWRLRLPCVGAWRLNRAR
jgi:hypothetical protein